ncbi:hypothetical protein M8818_006342 [Zalaria obscura]|uniref:Uncharacterized protein n=1 Tax=Zalaria obscura TaxID=2024903 RepID=A0ACC3S6I5_9PEZI
MSAYRISYDTPSRRPVCTTAPVYSVTDTVANSTFIPGRPLGNRKPLIISFEDLVQSQVFSVATFPGSLTSSYGGIRTDSASSKRGLDCGPLRRFSYCILDTALQTREVVAPRAPCFAIPISQCKNRWRAGRTQSLAAHSSPLVSFGVSPLAAQMHHWRKQCAGLRTGWLAGVFTLPMAGPAPLGDLAAVLLLLAEWVRESEWKAPPEPTHPPPATSLATRLSQPRVPETKNGGDRNHIHIVF